MLTKKFPFTSTGNINDIQNLYKKIQNEEPEYPKEAQPDLIDLLEKTFKKNPEERITLQQIIEHPWVTCNSCVPLELKNYQKLEINPKDAEGAFTQVKLV